MRQIFITIISIIFIGQSFSALALEAVKNSYKDWEVSCDIYNICTASTASIETKEGMQKDVFSLQRGEYQDYWEISLIANKAEPDQQGLINVSIDDGELDFATGQDFAAYGALNQYYFLEEKAQILLDSLKPANNLTISFSDEAGNNQNRKFSLSGLSAALLFIDEKQNQINIKHIAGKPPRDKMLVTSREPEPFPNYLLAEHKNPKFSGCDAIDELAQGSDIESFRLDATNTLFLVPCTAGAYNFSSVAYIKDEFETKMQLFATYWGENGWSGTQYLVNPYFDEKTKIIGDFYKGRGIGDCGTTGVWQWSGYSFRLLEYRAKSECGGEIDDAEEVGDFPIIYQAKDYIPPFE